jgi:hypothetical protein
LDEIKPGHNRFWGAVFYEKQVGNYPHPRFTFVTELCTAHEKDRFFQWMREQLEVGNIADFVCVRLPPGNVWADLYYTHTDLNGTLEGLKDYLTFAHGVWHEQPTE